jgi:hypothetical protein
LIGLINVTEEQILNYFTSEQFFSSEEENIFILSEPTSRPHKLSPPPPPLLPLVLLFFIQTENRKKGLTLFCLFQSRFYEQFLKPFLLDPALTTLKTGHLLNNRLVSVPCGGNKEI